MLKNRQNRNQMQMWSLESMIDRENTIRVIDAFVDLLDLEALGFVVKGKINNGAPAFQSADLLKLYYYGYLNKVNSSRRLERECKTNIETMWLIRCVQPGYKTIANFRKDNAKAMEKAFYTLNKFLRSQGLFDEDTVAVDGAKFRAQNSKKNNYNKKKVDQHLDYINKQTKQYLEELDQLDVEENETDTNLEKTIEIAQQLDALKKREDKYSLLKKKLDEASEKGENQISTTDPDARALPKKMNIVEVSYNALTAADLQNKLITNFKISNKSDTYALSDLALGARKVFEKKPGEILTVLADKGFDTGSELKICSDNDIQTLVAPKKRVHAKKNKAFNKDAFQYDEKQDSYICPQGYALTSNGNWYTRNKGTHRKSYQVKHYKIPFKTCNACPFRLECAGEANLKNSKGRYIERSEYQDYIDQNIERVKLNKELYRKRQQTIEHPFGTIKRQWGFDYTLVKTLEKVTGEFAIIFTAYNLRRAISILGVPELIKQLKKACLHLNSMIWLILSTFGGILLDNNIGSEKNKTRFEDHTAKLSTCRKVLF